MEEVEKTNESPASDQSDRSRHRSHGCSDCRRRHSHHKEDCTSCDGDRVSAMYCVHTEYMEVDYKAGVRSQSQQAVFSLVTFDLLQLSRCDALSGRTRPPE